MNFMGHWAILVPSSMKTKGHIILCIFSFQEARKEVVDIIVNVSKKTIAANFFLKWSGALALVMSLKIALLGVITISQRVRGGIRSFSLPLVCSYPFPEYVPG